MADRKAGGPRRPTFQFGGWARTGSFRLLAGLGGAGVLLVVLSGLFNTAGPAPTTAPSGTTGGAGRTRGNTAGVKAALTAADAGAVPTDPVLRYERALDQNVEAVLNQVGGAAPVTVAIDVASSPAHVLAQNTSSSQDRQGGAAGTVQSSEQDALAFAKGQVPVMTSESAPRVVGALVVAHGAGDPMVRAELTSAVETLLGLMANQVIVLPGR